MPRSSLSRRIRTRTRALARRIWRLLPQRVRDRLWPLLFTSWQPVEHSPARTLRPFTPPPSRVSASNPELAEQVASTVAVVLPVLDAGPELRRVLAAARRQRGLPSLEIVVADSGSSDGTRELAVELADRVIDVPPGEFGHGRTRNLAAETTSADVLVMLVQDALLLGRHALRDLVADLEADPHHAAVSARQVPRSDADLYASFVVVSHQRALAAARLRPRRGRWDPAALRALAGLDDVCGAIRREAWEELRFADVEFGEDLDFGLRALERGWTIGRSTRAAVAHSHSRPLEYHLNRAVLDRLHITAKVGEPPLPLTRGTTAGNAFAAGLALLPLLADAATARAGGGSTELAKSLRQVERALASGSVQRGELDGDLRELADCLQPLATESTPEADELVRDQMGSLLRWRHLEEFARGRPADAEETTAFVARLAASVVGRVAGETLRVGAQGDVVDLARQ